MYSEQTDMKFIKSIQSAFSKLSTVGKILCMVAVLLSVMVLFKSLNKQKAGAGAGAGATQREGFVDSSKFLFKTGTDVYDDFYATIYDHLVFNTVKNAYEIGEIVNNTNVDSASVILDIGSGTGHHVAAIAEKHLNVIGIDISPSMISAAKANYPQYQFKLANAMHENEFDHNSFTHILCLYFTIYYFQDKRKFFDNCMDWLLPGGYLVIHLVNRETFDPILPPGNPLYIVSPQKYAKTRITNTKITFNDFTYDSNFELDKSSDLAVFDEKFKFNDGKVRKQEQRMYMNDSSEILTIAQQCGFILQGTIDLVHCAYENQYLYILGKPN